MGVYASFHAKIIINVHKKNKCIYLCLIALLRYIHKLKYTTSLVLSVYISICYFILAYHISHISFRSDARVLSGLSVQY